MFNKILIANRGEIACRIIRTARRQGIATVAVYSDADADALHVAMADEAVHIGPAAAADSYLKIENVIGAARQCGADAIHPGYGFLSENAGFAEACSAAGIVFIGPPAAAIETMGLKSQAKNLMQQAGVPVIPGYHGADQDLQHLHRQADAIGYPVLIKASAGGGGKGMRLVSVSQEFSAALQSVLRESRSAFGSDAVLIEKYVDKPRHIEVQIFCDTHGNAVHLFERDCSVQRRHQKVLEEAPAPGLSEETRAAMGAAAVAAARSIDYVGAGTVEFILADDGQFYFMEMNTRLQVEHPVTELITGQDLVEWQFRVAAGEALPLRQQDLRADGHALEARLYAEDPQKDFLPASGLLKHLRFPADDAYIRVDTGVRQGDHVSVYYDPMIAKLIVWGRNREVALQRMSSALKQCEIVGVASNREFLRDVIEHPEFAAGGMDTGFIERRSEELLVGEAELSGTALLLAALYVLSKRSAPVNAKPDPDTAWSIPDAWRMNHVMREELRFVHAGDTSVVTVVHQPSNTLLQVGSTTISAAGTLESDTVLRADLDGHRVRATVVDVDGSITVLSNGRSQVFQLQDIDRAEDVDEAASGCLTAPMPGRIVQVNAAAGDRVEAGQALVVLEAMKMEHTITAPLAGKVVSVSCQSGDLVSEGLELLLVERVE